MDFEASYGDSTSHFYYNQIHKDFKDWRFGLSEVNLLTTINIDSSLSINARGQLYRFYGEELNEILFPLLNISYQPKDQDWSLTVGRFITPFGGFAANQHPKDRIFINIPLSFSYYTNISSKVGYGTNLGENRFRVNRRVDWGSTMLYYGGYSNGLQFDWSIKPDQVNWTLAYVNPSPNILSSEPFDFSNWAIVSKLQLQPKYFWSQGFSLSYGSFLEAAPINQGFDNFKQLLLETDMVFGYGFWELGLEVVGSFYDVPKLNPDDGTLSDSFSNATSVATSAYLKYEIPYISGSYLAYGFEMLNFGKYENESQNWDNRVSRHNFAVGYKVNSAILLRLNYLLQDVQNHPVWEQNTFRAILTLHY